MQGASIGAIVGLALIVACSASPAEGPARAGAAGGVREVDGRTAAPAGLDKTLALQGITFRVSCPTRGSINELRIEPEGLLSDNSPMVQDVDGTVSGAEVADLNADGSPEVYVYVQSTGSGSYGSLVAYSANNRRSLSGIYLPPITDHPEAAQGYMGHDAFAIVGDRLVQRFPIYKDGDPNAAPTGGTREVSYRLDAGEAGWVLRVAEVVDK